VTPASPGSGYREIERKFRVPAGFAVPDFSGVPGVAEVEAHPAFMMTNDYYDTADLRLFRWGITLRRRQGGPDAGWHLKLPVVGHGEGVRDEIRVPLTPADAGVPDELARIVAPFVRRGHLEHVAGLRTHRAPVVLLDSLGTPVIEVVDDHVDIVGGTSFREIEAEAMPTPDGALDEDLLHRVSELLLTAGATPGTTSKAGAALGPRAAVPPDVAEMPWPKAQAPAGDVVHAYLAQHTRRLLLADLMLRRDLPDAVHQMRVSARRLRSGLKVFAPLIDRSWATRIRDELGWMASGLGEARDTEVLQARLDAHTAELGGDDGARARALIDTAMQSRLALARDATDQVVASGRYLDLLEDLVDGVRRPPLTSRADRPADRVLPGLVAKAFDRLERRITGLSLDTPSAQWHEARIAAKRARYAADAVAPVIGSGMGRLAERLAEVTEVLGTHQDAHVAQTALRELASAGSASGQDAFALGRLLAVEQGAEMADRRDFLALWPSVRKAARRAGVA
jgi:CHAD domain-containing protein